MLSPSFNAIVPIMCVVAAGIAALLAEALRQPGERVPIAGLGVIGLVAAGISAAWLWNRNLTSFGVVSADNFGLFIVLVLVVIGLLTMAFSSQVVEPGSPAGRRILRDHAVCDERHDVDGDGQRSAGHLPRARGAVAFGVRAHRDQARQRGEHGGRLQVLPPRRILERGLPLRHRVLLRSGREHAPREDRVGPGIAGDGAERAGLRGPGPADGRLCVQGVGRAIPHVDAGRLPGRADDRDRLHVHRRQGGGLRRLRARLPVRVRAVARGLDAGPVGGVGRDDDRREHRGRAADRT